MSLVVKPLKPDTWGAFAELVERHGGVWGGCWCMEFHPDGKTRDSKRRGPTSVLDDSPTDVIEQALLVGFVGRKEQTGHPSQKPFKVYDQLLQMTVSDGGLILDPMCGSGTAGAVAKERGFRAILCDGSDEYTKLVEKRLGVKRLNITAEITNLLESVPPEAHAVVLLDGAGWHLEGGTLRVPDNLSLLRLPPYSPELNAQENIWQFLRQNFLAGRVFDTYEAIVDACCSAWNALTAETGRIQSIASRDWLQCVCS